MTKKKTPDISQIPPHSHCLWCRKPIPQGKLFCSIKCEREYKRWRRKRDFLSFLYLAVGFILMMIALFLIGR
ncbi:MAG: DUF2116 family Zn-ribbon domain-containing protein [Candidatus Njordarchaeales archaeon]